MARFTFHILWLLATAAFLIPVVGGPVWGYPVALCLAFLTAVCLTAYPTDPSLRWTLAAFGLFLLLPSLTSVRPSEFSWFTIREAGFTLLLGIACLWSAGFRNTLDENLRNFSQSAQDFDGHPGLETRRPDFRKNLPA